MSSGLVTRLTSSAAVRRLTPWGIVLLVGAILLGVLPTAEAQTGASASEAFPVGTDARFSGTVGPSSSLWYKFNYIGGNQQTTVSVSFEPPDSTRLDVFLYSGDPANPGRVGDPSVLSGNVRTLNYSTAGDPRVLFIRVENDHPDRSVSFVGTVTPANSVATPTPTSASNPVTPQPSPTAGPVAPNAANAILLASNNGLFSGTVGNGQAVWYSFYYGNPGADTTIRISVSPSADNVDLNLYTGTDITNLGPTQQSGNQSRDNNVISRKVNLPNAQLVYFALGNNRPTTVAYSGVVNPFAVPPATPTATAAATTVATTAATTVATATVVPTPSVVPTSPPVARDSQFYSQTGYRVDDQVVMFFQSRGAVDTFGYPISRMFTFLGCPVQMFQRLIIQLCPGSGPALINMLDPEIFPYTRVNNSVFPTSDEQLKASTPPVSSPDYSTQIIPFVQANTPDTFMGQPVNFYQTWLARGGLEVLGAPISHPQVDPTNSNFIYQRFQRVILHYRQGIGTEPLLLADYQKQIMLGPSAPALPPDLQQQASGSRFFNQYCRGANLWLCRPNELSGTDLTFAFEPASWDRESGIGNRGSDAFVLQRLGYAAPAVPIPDP